MTLISIVIPCYNHGLYVLDTIESIENQTYKNYEVIIVNDGSSDNYTLSILNSLELKGLQVIHQLNRGPAAARNCGINMAKGKYILPLDADDVLEPEFLEKTIVRFAMDSTIIGVSSYTRQFAENSGIIECKGGSISGFVGECPVVVASIILKSRWDEINGYDESMILGYEDWEFWIRYLADGGRIDIVKEPLFNYRVKNGSRVDQSKNNRLEIMEYMVIKNSNIYQKYAVEAIIDREKNFDFIEKRYKSDIEKLYNSITFRIGSFVLLPIKVLKRVFRRK